MSFKGESLPQETVWKFPLSPADELSIPMPENAWVLSAGVQNDAAYLWAVVDPSAKTKSRHFRLVSTGGHMPNENMRFISTIHFANAGLVFHVFEVE